MKNFIGVMLFFLRRYYPHQVKGSKAFALISAEIISTPEVLFNSVRLNYTFCPFSCQAVLFVGNEGIFCLNTIGSFDVRIFDTEAKLFFVAQNIKV